MNPARWLELRIRCPSRDPALLVETLLEAGGRAVWEEAGWQVSHLPDPEGPAAVEVVLAAVRAAFPDASDLEVDTRWQRQEDWAEYWKRGLEARRLTPRLVVTPSWITPATGPGDLVITLDPKMAFGNAEHGTTRGCLRLLDRTVGAGERILDVGTGSAILAIAAVLMGAEWVDALEADPLAIPAARENLISNGVADHVALSLARVTAADLQGMDPYDGVMANLETGFLRPLLPGLAVAVRAGGWLLLSGILAEEWEPLRGDVEATGLCLHEVDADGEWRSALLRRPPGRPAAVAV
ncbi:MAG: 50S ribosomal protein L11 methyltransferase [Longimicrobiales bacterium]|nr:50S ribosomal protein L11 methyltransferase [Longimicrobiales bacterium]